MAHPIVHVEIPAADPKAAAGFYSDLFGWKTEVDPNFDYWQFQAAGGPGGGFVKLDDTTKPGDVVIYIGTDNIESTLAKVESLGGKTVVPKTEIPKMGWFAILSDPTGNRIGLFTSTQHQS